MVNFLQLYKLLSIYKIIKPPKYGNCRVIQEEGIASKISAEDFKLIFNSKSEQSDKSRHVKNLLDKLNTILDTYADYECDDLFRSDISFSCDEITECIVFYIAGFVARKMQKKFCKCEECTSFFASSIESMSLPAAELVKLKTRGGLIFVNHILFDFLLLIEEYFIENITAEDNNYVYEKTTENVFNDPIFPMILTKLCEEHATDIVCEILHYYIIMRMRQWSKIENKDVVKKSKQLRKISRLQET